MSAGWSRRGAHRAVGGSGGWALRGASVREERRAGRPLDYVRGASPLQLAPGTARCLDYVRDAVSSGYGGWWVADGKHAMKTRAAGRTCTCSRPPAGGIGEVA